MAIVSYTWQVKCCPHCACRIFLFKAYHVVIGNSGKSSPSSLSFSSGARPVPLPSCCFGRCLAKIPSSLNRSGILSIIFPISLPLPSRLPRMAPPPWQLRQAFTLTRYLFRMLASNIISPRRLPPFSLSFSRLLMIGSLSLRAFIQPTSGLSFRLPFSFLALQAPAPFLPFPHHSALLPHLLRLSPRNPLWPFRGGISRCVHFAVPFLCPSRACLWPASACFRPHSAKKRSCFLRSVLPSPSTFICSAICCQLCRPI